MTLTVRDGYGTGDSNSTSIGIWVSSAPVILSEEVIVDGIAFSGEMNIIEAVAQDADMDSGMRAWRDDDLLSDSDNDGVTDANDLCADTLAGSAVHANGCDAFALIQQVLSAIGSTPGPQGPPSCLPRPLPPQLQLRRRHR